MTPADTNPLPTRADYDKAEPFQKGFMAYTFSQWPNSEIPSERDCPFAEDTENHRAFKRGIHAAVICAQDSEE